MLERWFICENGTDDFCIASRKAWEKMPQRGNVDFCECRRHRRPYVELQPAHKYNPMTLAEVRRALKADVSY